TARKPLLLVLLILYASPALLIVALGFRPRVFPPLPGATVPSVRVNRPDEPLAMLQWKGLPPAADLAPRQRQGEKYMSAVQNLHVLQAALEMPGVADLVLVQKQIDPVTWLKGNVHVSVWPSVAVMSEFGPGADDSASATTVTALASAPG